MNKKRNGEMDLLKFIFALFILLYHSSNLASDGTSLLQRGNIAVSFFFIVSGLFMAKSASAVMNNSDLDIGESSASFMWKKIKGLMPDYYIAWFIALYVECTYVWHIETFSELMERRGGTLIYELAFLGQAGFDSLRANAVTWYLSAMLISMAVYFPIMLHQKRRFTHITAPVIALAIFGYVYATSDNGFGSPMKFSGLMMNGLIRAMAEIALGCFLFTLAEKLKNVKATWLLRTIISAVTAACFAYTLYYAQIGADFKIQVKMVAAISVIVVTAYSGQNIWNRLFSNGVCSFLGIFSLDLYLSHGFWSHAILKMYPDMSYDERMKIYMPVAFCTAACVMAISKILKKVVSKYGKHFSRYLISEK